MPAMDATQFKELMDEVKMLRMQMEVARTESKYRLDILDRRMWDLHHAFNERLTSIQTDLEALANGDMVEKESAEEEAKPQANDPDRLFQPLFEPTRPIWKYKLNDAMELVPKEEHENGVNSTGPLINYETSPKTSLVPKKAPLAHNSEQPFAPFPDKAPVPGKMTLQEIANIQIPSTARQRNSEFLPYALEAIYIEICQMRTTGELMYCDYCAKPRGLPICFRERHFAWCVKHNCMVPTGLEQCAVMDKENCHVVLWENLSNWSEFVDWALHHGMVGQKGISDSELQRILFT